MIQLTAEEVRVAGALIEKSQATPEYYPMTVNALISACNQKSSRDPVVSYSDDTVEYVLESLRDKGLSAMVSGTGRVVRHTHRFGNTGLGLTPAQCAALSLVMLRGPQTASEIRTKTERQFRFPSLEFTQEVIAGLTGGEDPFLEEAPRRPGQKEARFRHRFHPHADEAPLQVAVVATPSILDEVTALRGRIERIERFLHELGFAAPSDAGGDAGMDATPPPADDAGGEEEM